MTEDEAKTKWCCGGPMAMLGLSQTITGDKLLPQEGKCVASACMAWRATDNEGGPWSPSEETQPVSKPAGYCGLAGRP